jgi:hypothetical protein
MKRWISVCSMLLTTVCLLATQSASADHRQRLIRAQLASFEEVPTLVLAGSGIFIAWIKDDEISYFLRYSDLDSNVTQAHIHLGQRHVNGGIAVWLCSNLASPPTPANVQPCPERSGEITGVIKAADVQNVNVPGSNPPVSTGLTAGEFADLVAALRANSMYANVHTMDRPGGQIRGQVE